MLLRGVVPPMLTPVDARGRVMTESAAEMAEYYIRLGVHALYVLGSTGEAFVLPVRERKRMTEAVVRHVAGRVPVVVQVGSLVPEDSAALARHASDVGADAVSSVPPLFYPPDRRELVLHYRSIADASPLPVYLYYIDMATMPLFPMDRDTIRALVEIENVVGMKFSSSDFYLMREILDMQDRPFNLMCGYEHMLVAGLATGAHGVIGGLVALIPKVYLDLWEAWNAGDLESARSCQTRANVLLRGFVSGGRKFNRCKWIMKRMIGIDAGQPALPHRDLTPEEEAQMPEWAERHGLGEMVLPA